MEIRISSSATEWSNPWRQLWTRENGDPFLHPAWNEAYVEAHRERITEPFLIGAWHDGSLVGLLPMRIDPDRVLRFLTSHPADYEDALFAREHQDAVLASFADQLCRRRFELLQMPQGSLLASELQKRGVKSQPSAPCPGIQLSQAAVQDVTSRKSLKRHEKKLSRLGPVRLESVPPEELDRALSEFFDQHVARRLLAGDESLFLDPRNRDFYRLLVGHPAFPDFGVFHVLRSGGRNAAFHLGLRNAQTFIWYKPTFDMNLEADGPGEVLLKVLVEHAGSTGASYFDFSRGNEPFKLRFANEHRANQSLSHRLPVRNVARTAIHRVAAALHRKAEAWTSRPDPIRDGQTSGPAPMTAPTIRPEPPEGFDLSVGEPDLVEFGALHTLAPKYVNTWRMRAAVKRHRQKDLLFVVRRRDDRLPVCFAWLRMPVATTAQDHGPSQMEQGSETAVIFDCWQHPDVDEPVLQDFAACYLAWYAGSRGFQVVFRPDASLEERPPNGSS